MIQGYYYCDTFYSGFQMQEDVTIYDMSCRDITMTMVTMAYGNENSWKLEPNDADGNSCENDKTYASFDTDGSQSCCLYPGLYKLTCKDV